MSTSVPGSLGADQRARDIQRLTDETFDVLVIGGGVTGVGCALDAASRGLRVGLVEQRDLASGTSSRSSKLLHGGLRYLEQLDFALVHEALQERGLLTKTVCPHLVRPVSFLLPLTERVWQRTYYGAGVALYDLLAFSKGNPLPHHQHLSRTAALDRAPGLKRSSLIGGILYHDAQIDDARHTLAVARTASARGAAIATSVQVTGLVVDDGVVRGAEVEDLESGTRFAVAATKVVNATGVWIDDIQDMAGPTGLRVAASKGIHIVIARERFRSDTGIILRTPSSVLFIIPWGDHWLLGTTDTPWSLDRAHPSASSADIDYILGRANEALEEPLTRGDIIGTYAGLRPLIEAKDDDTTKMSREHAVAEPVPGLVSIAGGKYTTYRVMAEDTIDVVAEGLGRSVPDSCTDSITLLGSENWDDWKDAAPRLAAEYDMDADAMERLLWRHGSRVGDVLAIAAEAPGLADELDRGYLAAEVVHAARNEGALHVEDVLARRMRLAFEDPERGTDVAARTADLMATELGWDADRTAAEVDAWDRRVSAERAAAFAEDDKAADALRRRAVDARGLVDTRPT